MLFIQDSMIPGAGKGLFTDAPIKKGETIIEYTGEKITWKQCQKRNEALEDINGYFFFVSKNNCIDARETLDSLGRYANDAKGLTRIEGLKNNAEYEIRKHKPYIVAKRNIKAGEEILVAYGKEYWDVMKEHYNNKSNQKLIPQNEEVLSEVA
jgi:SET domain-containing protein